ncbi:hypothetical protein Hanom_Chr03g00273431 [Helianthus anomalus]
MPHSLSSVIGTSSFSLFMAITPIVMITIDTTIPFSFSYSDGVVADDSNHDYRSEN